VELRQYLDKLKQQGQLNTIEEPIDWKLQAGAICSASNRNGGPAVLLNNIKDYSKGFSLAGGLYTGPPNVLYAKEKPWSRQAIMLGLDPEVDWEGFVSEMTAGIANPIKPIQVTSGPCKQNIISGEDVDVLKLPVPYLHEGDGGRYGTCSFVIVKDPETNWQYWGFHRWMVIDRNRLAGPLEPTIAPFLSFPPYHLSIIYEKYRAQKKAMPFCIVIGGDPANLLALRQKPMTSWCPVMLRLSSRVR
jgi:4-hydroxy-3-polyprenylbenzoate decarboxylase